VLLSNALTQFEEAFQQGANEQYDHEHNVFERQQQQLYEQAMIFQEEGLQEQKINVPIELVEEDDVDPDEENDAVENEEENVAEVVDQVREQEQLNLINHALTLDVIGTTANNHHPK
jgi:hypothetical protein